MITPEKKEGRISQFWDFNRNLELFDQQHKSEAENARLNVWMHRAEQRKTTTQRIFQFGTILNYQPNLQWRKPKNICEWNVGNLHHTGL